MENPEGTKRLQVLKNFYNNMSKRKIKESYTIDEKGNLVVKGKDGAVISTIELEYYRPYTSEEFTNIEKERVDKIIELENAIETVRKRYKEAETIEDQYNINAEIQTLEQQKTYIISPYQIVKEVKGLEVREVQKEESEEKRKQKFVFQVVRRDFPLVNLYGTYTKSKEVVDVIAQKGIRLEPGEVFLNNGRVARFFNENDANNEFLSIFDIREFVYNETKFASAYQAFEVTRLMELGKDDLAKKVLNTRSIKTIRYLVREVREKLEDLNDVWKEILEDYYKQHPDLIKKLVDTKDAMLVFANTNPYLGGIGLTVEDERRLDIKNWKQNIVGEVLMELRSEFAQGVKKEEVKVGGTVKQSVVSEETVEMRKKMAIINAMKKKHV